MLNSAAIARPLRVSEMYRDACRVDDAGPKVVQFLDRVRDQNANPTSPLNRYIEGWAQTDLEKILDATAPSYRFTDPFVGSFQVAAQILRSLAGQTLLYRSDQSARSRFLPARPNEAAVG